MTFRPVADEASEGAHALFLELELGAPDALAGFLESVVARFTAACSDGPPRIHFMLITVIGDIAALDFVRAWRAAIEHHAPARALLGMMHQADVMQGDHRARLTGHASLLAPLPDEPPDAA
ncbi:MAG TPA: hypothetical protein VFP84_37660 [Kofleriaceae bacterium]|nr:hypothetical protein [Kofleriaceae bacterium]